MRFSGGHPRCGERLRAATTGATRCAAAASRCAAAASRCAAAASRCSRVARPSLASRARASAGAGASAGSRGAARVEFAEVLCGARGRAASSNRHNSEKPSRTHFVAGYHVRTRAPAFAPRPRLRDSRSVLERRCTRRWNIETGRVRRAWPRTTRTMRHRVQHRYCCATHE